MNKADVIIVGGGPGGLMAALYLARFNRSFIAFDSGHSRARLIGRAHNYPTYAEGISGNEILSRLKAQAHKYGAAFIESQVSSIIQRDEGFIITAEGEDYRAKAVILATGIRDILPAIEGIESAILAGRVGLCPVCHAYESNGKTVAILTDGPRGMEEAKVMTRYADRVTVLSLSEIPDSSVTGIACYPVALSDIQVSLSVTCQLADGRILNFDQLYCALGRAPQNDLAVSLGAKVTAEGCLVVDKYQETSVKNVFAIGDVVKGLDQMVLAEAEAAIATAHVNSRLSGLS